MIEMPEVKLPDVVFSWDSVVYAVALIVAVAGVLVALVKGWEAWKKISVRDRVKKLEGRMSKVEARLSLGDRRFELQNDDIGAMLATQKALLLHFITGNDHKKLQDELVALDSYMNTRATRMGEYASEHEELQNGGTSE
jgi:hypothetical protein